MPKPQVTEESRLRICDHMVEGLRKAYSRGLAQLPDDVLNVIETEAWQERYVERLGQKTGFATFEDFVKAEPLEGLGGCLDQLKKACEHRTDVMSQTIS